MGRRLLFIAAGTTFVALEIGMLAWIVARLWFSPAAPLPTITVEATYAGANAAVVADAVAAPIEQQVNGVENMVQMASQSRGDGSYSLRITFARGTDMNMAQVLVQNRVSLALPVLPAAVQTQGIAVRKGNGTPILYVVLTSPDNRFDSLYLSNYATLHVRDELARVAGVGQIVPFGVQDLTVRVMLDPEKLAVRRLSALDVVRALQEQNITVKGSSMFPGGDRFELQFGERGRLLDVDQLGDTVLRTDAGQAVRLKDVARSELGGARVESEALLDGKPVVALGIALLPDARPGEVAVAVHERLRDLRKHLPVGLDLATACDSSSEPERLAASRFLTFDVELPALASRERTVETLIQGDRLLRETAGVEHVFALAQGPPLQNRGCMLVELSPDGRRDRDKIAAGVRARLADEIHEAAIRLRDPRRPGRGPLAPYAIDLAVLDDRDDPAKLGAFVEKLAARLTQGGKLTDVWSSHAPEQDQELVLEIHRDAAEKHGVAASAVLRTLEVALGTARVDCVDAPAPRTSVLLTLDSHQRAEDILGLKIRNAAGEMVPLSALVTMRKTRGAGAIQRVELYRAVEITANPSAGVSVAEARKYCETVADEVRTELGLGGAFRIRWLTD
ncbi:hypothetical protein AYO40_06520 [Planctomycetaceae bacterium SCGC AG-212-D15]|nr:hypothetical protein AYO40_06520 [Planctomycetaceae bacterium SCGC AG-212-D15]